MKQKQQDKTNNIGNRSLTVGVIGGGPSGLAAAARLAEQGVSVHLFESNAQLGGLARSFDLWGRQIELSAHIFRSSDSFVNSLWCECAGELIKIPLRRGIYDGKGIVEYPMTPWRILKNLGFLETLRSVLGIGVGRLSNIWKSEPKNAQEWMIRNYGKPLHSRFLNDYAEKLWGVSCKQIHARFPQFLFQSANDSKGDESFLYPRQGNSFVWNNLGEKLEKNGVIIHKQSRVSKLLIENKVVVGLIADDQQFTFDHIVSTMPLGILGRLALGNNSAVTDAASVLKARSTVLVYIQSKAGGHSKFNWLSIYPSQYKMGRITDFGHWLKTSDGTTIYCLEYWCDKDDELWSQGDEELVALALDELNETQLVGDVSVLKSHIMRIPNTHPVFSLKSQTAIDTLSASLDAIEGLSTVGRHGSHGVLGMGESMEAARKVADHIATNE